MIEKTEIETTEGEVEVNWLLSTKNIDITIRQFTQTKKKEKHQSIALCWE